MRLLAYIVALATLTYVVLVARSNHLDPTTQSIKPSTPSPAPQPKSITSQTGDSYQYVIHFVADPQTLHLITNYQTSLTSKDLIKTYNCQFSVNGGFYQTDRRPLGWLFQSDNEISPAHESHIHNAFFAITAKGPYISSTQPTLTSGFGFQSGPLLIKDGLPLLVNLNPDEPRRRIIAALTNGDQLYFIAVFDPNTPFGGPTLKVLPGLLTDLQQKEHLVIHNALNLDGGSASVFYEASGIYLQELYPVGSLLCQ